MTKNGLRGFAGGLIVATIVLSFFYYQSDKAVDAETTKSDVESFANENNLIILTEEEYNNVTEQNKNEEKPKEVEEKKAKEDKQEEPKEEEKVEATLEISPGMSTAGAADKLQELKIIKNKKDFTDYIKKHKLEGSVKSGSYKLNSEMTIKEIATIVTK